MFVYQKDSKLNITFIDDNPVTNPEIILDIVDDNKLSVNNFIVDAINPVEIVENTVYTEAQTIDTAKTVVLNGHTISIPEDTAGDGVYHVVEGGYLTIEGPGVIDGVGKNNYNMAIWADGGTVVINGGHFTNKGATATKDPSHFDLIYAKNGGVVEINGGYFECETPKWTLNNNDAKPGKFVVRGGTFVGFDPSFTDTEPVGANNNFVAPGYKSVYCDGCYKVVKI